MDRMNTDIAQTQTMSSKPSIPLGTLAEFDHTRARSYCLWSRCRRAPPLQRDLGGRRVLLVTDPGIVAAGHAGRIQGYIEAAGLEVLFSTIRTRIPPPLRSIVASKRRRAKIDFILAVGGSSMDTLRAPSSSYERWRGSRLLGLEQGFQTSASIHCDPHHGRNWQ